MKPTIYLARYWKKLLYFLEFKDINIVIQVSALQDYDWSISGRCPKENCLDSYKVQFGGRSIVWVLKGNNPSM